METHQNWVLFSTSHVTSRQRLPGIARMESAKTEEESLQDVTAIRLNALVRASS